jgi:hypothetical protein
LFNQITAGTANKDYKSANGRFEFNTENVFSLPLTPIDRKETIIGKYRTDSFGVTDTRLTFAKQSTTTGESDNDIFLIHAVKKTVPGIGERYVPYGLAKSERDIFKDDIQKERTGMFNFYLSPKRCLMRHGRILAGMLHKTSGILKFTSTAKTDAILESRLLGAFREDAPIKELDDYNVSGIQPVWLPTIYEIECKLPRDLIRVIDENPHGYVQFTFRDKVYRGFPTDMRQEHWTNPGQTIKMLACPF